MTAPILFISHGAPTYAIEPGAAGARLNELGASLLRATPRPAAVLVVSPHWTTRGGVRVTGAARPGTIHDFRGFPAALDAIRYDAPGAPEVARRVLEHLRAAGFDDAAADETRGLDHGAWVPLLHLFPHADVPTLQVSMPADLDEAGALALGRALAPLAAEGVLVIGSGSLTHNLGEVRWDAADGAPDPYAVAFVEWIRGALASRDTARLARVMTDAPHATRAHPTTEHLLPLLVAAGAAAASGHAAPEVIEGGFSLGNLSMESYGWGLATRSS